MFVARVTPNDHFEPRRGGTNQCEGNYAPTGLDRGLGNPGVYKHCAPLELGLAAAPGTAEFWLQGIDFEVAC